MEGGMSVEAEEWNRGSGGGIGNGNRGVEVGKWRGYNQWKQRGGKLGGWRRGASQSINGEQHLAVRVT